MIYDDDDGMGIENVFVVWAIHDGDVERVIAFLVIDGFFFYVHLPLSLAKYPIFVGLVRQLDLLPHPFFF